MIQTEQLRQGRFVAVHPWMIEACEGDAVVALVLGHMVFRTFNGEHWHTATAQEVSDDTGLSIKQTRRALDVLRELGHIRSRRADRFRPTLEWTLVLTDTPSGVSRDAPEERYPQRDTTDTPTGGSSVVPPQGDLLLVEVEEQHQDAATPQPVTTARLTQFSLIAPPVLTADPFDEFWAKYPKKVGKGAARKSLATALRRTTWPVILAAVEKQCRTTWKGKDRQYIPNPATWLNQERWDDEPQETAPIRTGRSTSDPMLPNGQMPKWKPSPPDCTDMYLVDERGREYLNPMLMTPHERQEWEERKARRERALA